MNDSDSSHSCSVQALTLYPIKSCGAVVVQEALLIETGFEFDRAWMVVDAQGAMLTQRVLPRMALVQPTLRHADMVLRAPGMLALHVALDRVEAPTRVRVGNDVLKAYDMGDLAAQWFTDFLGPAYGPLRLVRFDPDERRLSSPQWTGGVDALTAFTDAFPLLVTNAASLDDLNARLAARGEAAVTMQRFRPNIVLDGLQAYDEDHLDEVVIDTGEGAVTLKLVKPCVRCSIPNVDPATAATGHEPGDTLAGYRADARMQGGITFGVNAIVLDGVDRVLRVGQRATGSWQFD